MTNEKKFRTLFIFLCVWFVTNLNFVWAQDQPEQKKEAEITAQSYTVFPAASDIKVDGTLDEPAWEKATVIKVPYEYIPGDNIPGPVDTDFLITFDENFLYMAFKCYDPEPSKIRAHLMDRDATDTLIQDDHISIMLDTFNDERRGFQFRVNPLGVQADANFSEMEGYEDFSWDAIWNSAGKITDWGYVIEISIPFNQLRFARGSEVQTWGVSVERSYPRSVRHRIASHMRRRDLNCILCQFNKVTGFQGMKTGYNIELDPTLTANRTDIREDFPAGGMVKGDENIDPGLSFRWGITPNLIMNAAINPDFSQVEADVRELEVNTRFAIRYPEKRPFFLEGADFFLTPVEAVFTRTVADPDGGVKFTGKIGRNAFGFFATVDRINNLLFPSNQGSSSASLDQNVMGGVFRYRRDVGQGSALGALYTGRAADGYYNHLGGIDGFFRLSRTKTVSFQLLHSESDYSKGTAASFGQEPDSFNGNAVLAEFQHMGREWMYGGTYYDLSPGFRADFGYVPRVDMRRLSGFLSRIFWGKPGGWYDRLMFSFQGFGIYDYDKNLTDRVFMLNSMYIGPMQSTVQFAYTRKMELFLENQYDLNQLQIVGEIKPAGGLRFMLVTVLGDEVDYSNSRNADSLVLLPAAELGLGRHINLNLQHTFQRLSFEGEQIFQANLTQLKLIYNFNVRCFVRGIVQYLDVYRNPDLYLFPVLPKTETLFSQFLFSYKLNPQTVLFLGYSDNYLGMTGIDIGQTDRTFFVKLGYAWTR